VALPKVGRGLIVISDTVKISHRSVPPERFGLRNDTRLDLTHTSETIRNRIRLGLTRTHSDANLSALKIGCSFAKSHSWCLDVAVFGLRGTHLVEWEVPDHAGLPHKSINNCPNCN
jgi:hypothetical protein